MTDAQLYPESIIQNVEATKFIDEQFKKILLWKLTGLRNLLALEDGSEEAFEHIVEKSKEARNERT